MVSTHSRLKAAGRQATRQSQRHLRFNTQPPEGGWLFQALPASLFCLSFNTQPPEGGWVPSSRWLTVIGCFNTQPPEGGWLLTFCLNHRLSCFNTQPPEGGWEQQPAQSGFDRSFNTQPPEGGWPRDGHCFSDCGFAVSTHSRLKAAGALASASRA